MNIEQLNKIEEEKYNKIRVKIVFFEIIMLIIILPAIWVFPQYVQIKHAIGITLINAILYGFAYLKQKRLV